ncbi:MAG: hypothetical protein ACR2KQ_11425 [Actinomycetota bacterium]
MKKLLILTLIAGLALAPAAQAGKKKKKKAAHQHVEGAIALPQPYAADGTCIYRTQRALVSTVGYDVNGFVGYTFEVDKKTAGKPFKLDVSDGAGVDISFYSELGDPSDPTTAPANMPYETAGPGGEKGKVPPGFPIAFVCMTEGSDATFSYMAGKGVK